jgi:hypothetical protein
MLVVSDGSAIFKSVKVAVLLAFGVFHIIFLVNITKNFAACSLVIRFCGWKPFVVLYFVIPFVYIILIALSSSVHVDVTMAVHVVHMFTQVLLRFPSAQATQVFTKYVPFTHIS